MKGFFYGLGIGVAVGVLFAPMSGDETRNTLRERAGDLGDNFGQLTDQARQAMDQGREKLRTGVQSIRGQVNDLVGGSTGGSTQATGTESK